MELEEESLALMLHRKRVKHRRKSMDMYELRKYKKSISEDKDVNQL